MASRIGNRAVGGADKALDLLRTLPRVSLGNLKSNPQAFKKVLIFSSRIFFYLYISLSHPTLNSTKVSKYLLKMIVIYYQIYNPYGYFLKA